jgi:hypothetical protein
VLYGVALSGFAHGSGEAPIFHEPADCGAKRSRVTWPHNAGAGFLYDPGRTNLGRDYHRHAALHGFQHGVTKIF